MDPSNDERPARLLTVSEVAQALRVSNMTVYRLVSAGDLPALRVGRSVRLRPADVESYLSGRLIKAG
jgi:excisionase family DNA binding protein